MHRNWLWIPVFATMAALSACGKQGPVERMGEEIDEAVDTLKSGEESTANKLDDAADKLREGAQDAVEEIKK